MQRNNNNNSNIRRASPPPVLHRHQQQQGGSSRPLVLDEEISGSSYHPRSQGNHSSSSATIRNLDASTQNATMGGGGSSKGLWKGFGKGGSHNCQTCSQMGRCDCAKTALSPNTRRQRQNSVLTPYDLAKKSKDLTRCQRDESENRTYLVNCHHFILQSMWQGMSLMGSSGALLSSHQAAVAGFFFASRTEVALGAIEINEASERKRYKVERLQWLNKVYTVAEVEGWMAELSTEERFHRYSIDGQEEQMFKVIGYALDDHSAYLHECTQQRNRFMKDTFAGLAEIRNKEQLKWMKVMEYEQVEQERQYADRKLREEFITEALQRIFVLREKQENKREQIRQRRHAEHDEIAEYLAWKKEQTDSIIQECMSEREEGFMEEQHQRTQLALWMASDLEAVHKVTAHKHQQRLYCFTEFLDARNLLMNREVSIRGHMVEAFHHEHEETLQWVNYKADERKTFFDHSFVELRAIITEEEQQFLQVLKHRRDEGYGVLQWTEAKRESRHRYEQSVMAELSQIAVEADKERHGIRTEMKSQKQQILEWRAEQGTEVSALQSAELERRTTIQDTESRTRNFLVEDLHDAYRAIEIAAAELDAAVATLSNDHNYGIGQIAAEYMDTVRLLKSAMQREGCLAMERRFFREQKHLADQERGQRDLALMDQIQTWAHLLAQFEAGNETFAQMREEALRFEMEALLNEDKIIRNGLAAQWLEVMRVVHAEEHLSQGRAQAATRERLEEEMAQRQICLLEEPRLFDEICLEEPLIEGRQSTVEARISMRRSSALVATSTASNNAGGHSSWSFFGGGISADQLKKQEEEELEMKKNFIISVIPSLEDHILTMRSCELDAFAAVLEMTEEFKTEDRRIKQHLESQLAGLRKKSERLHDTLRAKEEVSKRLQVDKVASKKKHAKQMQAQREENLRQDEQVKIEDHRRLDAQKELKEAKDRTALLQKHYHRKVAAY